MSTCKSIQPLLHLHRHGERTADERHIVQQHLLTCERCSAIWRRLTELDTHLAKRRAEIPFLEKDFSHLVSIVRRQNGKIPIPKLRPLRDIGNVLNWIHPAFAAMVVAAISLLIFQEVRDAASVAELEQRLQKPMGLTTTQALRRSITGYLGEVPAGVAKESLEMLSSIVPHFLGEDNRMFTRLAKRYPNLARVNPDDGLDAWERNVLATEGRAFLLEVENLIKEGNK